AFYRYVPLPPNTRRYELSILVRSDWVKAPTSLHPVRSIYTAVCFRDSSANTLSAKVERQRPSALPKRYFLSRMHYDMKHQRHGQRPC
ncbi:hypothetical protein M514_28308, partial [Trichuris suis]